MSEPLLALRDIVFGYEPGRPVLQRCSLALHRGEKIGLAGPNGSGKSTLLKIMMGLLRPQLGDRWAFGRMRRATDDDFLEVRRRVGMLFQDVDDQLFCPTVLEDVCFGPLNLGMGRAEAVRRAAAVLALVGLQGFEERVTFRLSEGEKRLVALAGVLAMEPEALLLDEPLAGLDRDAARRVSRLIRALPLSMVIVAHDRDFLAESCDRIVELRGGRITRSRPETRTGRDSFPAPVRPVDCFRGTASLPQADLFRPGEEQT
ncbi:MAG TPA: ABC transporter ATP-binding protein [Kiritimatiellae bacterium]|nr:ABC transporter ATP-binding protein [Kiritimatiellia bacterium]